MNYTELMSLFSRPEWKKALKKIYSDDAEALQKKRYEDVVKAFGSIFGEDVLDIQVFSSPGRTEIGGNHTDHNHGKVLTGSIDLDVIAVAAPANDGKIRIHDLKYNEDFVVDINETEKRAGEKGLLSLLRGILHAFSERGFEAGGFSACVHSNVIGGAGVSSSAALEMLICLILNDMYNHSKIPKSVWAQIGQYAENKYWDKQSGLLDQMACAIGGLVSIDFANPASPQIQQIKGRFSDYGYGLVIVNTGGNHADLSEEYSSIPHEMKSVAKYFEKSVCREITREKLLSDVKNISKKTGDRAVLRALHFFEENDRVQREVDALEKKDFAAFLSEVTASGDSSWKWLQNCYCPGLSFEQEIPLTLALTDLFIRKKGVKAALRVHGGGFAGVIMTILPDTIIDEYIKYINKAGKEAYRMNIREYGSIKVTDLL